MPTTVRDWLNAMTDSSSLESICEPFQPTRGAPALLPLADLIRLGVYHAIAPSGTRSTHAADVAG